MGQFDDAIRSAIATLDQVTSDGGLQVSVTHRAYVQQDAFGDADPYGAPVTRSGILVEKKQQFHSLEGQQVQTQSRLTFLGNIPFTVHDEVTLPDGTRPPILDVHGIADRTGGRMMTVVTFGQMLLPRGTGA